MKLPITMTHSKILPAMLNGSSMETSIINAFQSADFIDNSITDESIALNLTFGDISDSDIRTFIENMLAANSGELIASFINEIVSNDISETTRFNTTNDYYVILTKIFPTLNVDDLVYQVQSFDFDNFNQIDGLYNNDDSSVGTTATLTTHQLQLILDHYITQRFDNPEAAIHNTLADGYDLESRLMMELLVQKTVLDPYKASINNHMDKLGDFLFAPEPNTNNLTDYIDTWNELGAHLDDPSKDPEIAHYDNLAFLLLRDPAHICQTWLCIWRFK